MTNTKQGLLAYRIRERSISSINKVGLTSPSHYIEMPHTQTSTSSGWYCELSTRINAPKFYFALLLYDEYVWGAMLNCSIKYIIVKRNICQGCSSFFVKYAKENSSWNFLHRITLNIWRYLNQPQWISKRFFENLIIIFWNGNIIGLNYYKDKIPQNKACFFMHTKSFMSKAEPSVQKSI